MYSLVEISTETDLHRLVEIFIPAVPCAPTNRSIYEAGEFKFPDITTAAAGALVFSCVQLNPRTFTRSATASLILWFGWYFSFVEQILPQPIS